MAVYGNYLLGEIFLNQGEFSSSIKEFNSILNNPQAQALWGTALIANYWSNLCLGSFDEANKVFQRLVKLNPYEEEKAFIQWLNAEVAFYEGRMPDALPYYFNIMNSRFRERALFQIGRGYFYEKQFREAITNLDMLSLEFPNSKYRDESLFVKGESYVSTGKCRAGTGDLRSDPQTEEDLSLGSPGAHPTGKHSSASKRHGPGREGLPNHYC